MHSPRSWSKGRSEKSSLWVDTSFANVKQGRGFELKHVFKASVYGFNPMSKEMVKAWDKGMVADLGGQLASGQRTI